MLSTEDREFICKEMKISLESIESKLSEHSLSPYKNQLEDAISYFICSIHAQNKIGYKLELSSCQESPAEKEINIILTYLHFFAERKQTPF